MALGLLSYWVFQEMVPWSCLASEGAVFINTVVKRLHTWERYNNQMACFQPVRTKLFELPTTSASQ